MGQSQNKYIYFAQSDGQSECNARRINTASDMAHMWTEPRITIETSKKVYRKRMNQHEKTISRQDESVGNEFETSGEHYL